MRVVLLSTGHPTYDVYPDGGGIQRHIHGLATEIAGKGHEVYVICRSAEEELLSNSRVAFLPIPLRGQDQVVSVLRFSKQAASIIRRLEPDVVSAFERFSAYFPSLGFRPMTFTTENYDAFRYYHDFAVRHNPLNVWAQPWKRRLEEGVMRRSARVIALTPYIQSYLKSVGIHHVEVVPNGVRVEDYKNRGDGGYILYAGRLDAPKRVDLLIRAFADLDGLNRQYLLRIVGRGGQHGRLADLASQLGIRHRVEFVGWLGYEGLLQMLGRCTVFVLPSEYEGLPLALLEAMACGKPVVGSNIPGIRDILEDNRTGWLFKNDDLPSLTAILRAALEDSDRRATIGNRARKTIMDDFDIRKVVQSILNVFQRVRDEARVGDLRRAPTRWTV